MIQNEILKCSEIKHRYQMASRYRICFLLLRLLSGQDIVDTVATFFLDAFYLLKNVDIYLKYTANAIIIVHKNMRK